VPLEGTRSLPNVKDKISEKKRPTEKKLKEEKGLRERERQLVAGGKGELSDVRKKKRSKRERLVGLS